MSLTPEEIQAVASQRGDTVVNSTGSSSIPMSAAEAFAQRTGYNPNASSDTSNDIKVGGKTVVGGPVGGMLKTIGSAAQSGFQQAKQGVDQVSEGGGPAGGAVTGLEGGIKVASGISSILSSPLAPIFKPLIDAFQKSASGDKNAGLIGDLINKITDNPEFQKFAMSDTGQTTSRVAEDVSNLGNVAGTIAGVGEAATKVPEVASTIKNIPESAINVGDTLASKMTGTAEGNATIQAGSDLQKIKEMITPKPTIKEAKLALEQGRLYSGSESGLLKEGTPSGVATSDQQFKSVQTINRLIPDAAKMDPQTLFSTLDEKISTTAKQLQPQMEATPLNRETIQKISDDISNLKKTQLDEAKATDEPNVAKWQSNFEKIVNKNLSRSLTPEETNAFKVQNLTDAKYEPPKSIPNEKANLNDIWNAAKEYDQSIKANVKNATELSPEDLQTQKDIWLQNRAVLRNAMTDAETELGPKAKQAFSDMRDMYEAQNGIMSKAKIETTAKPSKVGSFIEKNKGKLKVGAGIVGGGALLEGAKHLIP